MKISLATKIFIAFTLLLLVFGAVSIYGVVQLAAVRNHLNVLNRGLLPLYQEVVEIETLQKTTQRSIDNAQRSKDTNLVRGLLDNTRQLFARNMPSLLSRCQAVLKRLDLEELSEIDQTFMTDVGNRIERISGASTEFNQTLEMIVRSLEPLPNENPEDLELPDSSTLQQIGRGLAPEVRLLKLSLKNRITSKMLTVEKQENATIGVMLWLSILSILIGVVVTAVSLAALRPIKRVVEGVRRISRGDFAPIAQVAADDEFGLLAREFNRMASSLAHREEELTRQHQQLEYANRELRQSGLNLQLVKLYNENIIRSVPTGILVADAQGVVTTLNPAAERLWGLNPSETVGKKLPELPLGKNLRDLLADWEAVLLRKERKVYEAIEFAVSQSPVRLVDLHVSPLVGNDGLVQGVLVIGEDVTEKVRTKQALLQNERLATIGRMSAMVAHEIRNPLSSIGLNAELLEEELAKNSDLEMRALLHAISREVERLTAITDEYLKFARLPKPTLQPEQLNDLLRDLLRFVDGELRAAKVELTVDLEGHLTPIRADDNQLRQAFLNLLKNSLHSMPEGGRLTITTQQHDGRVQVRFADTGQGIDTVCIDRIFDPFVSGREGGIGLGLSLTQQIVSEHGGMITCESTPGQGTVFVIEFPASPLKEAEDAPGA
jgi:PAS domain S-box-containing protein